MGPSGDLTWEQVRHELLPLARPDARVSALCIAREYAGLALTLAGCAAAYRAWSGGTLTLAGFVPLAVLGIAAVAAFQHRLSGLAHDASHYALFRNRLANDLVSDLFLMFPILAFTQTYRAAHLGHHQFVNDPERDPDLVRINTPVPQGFPVSKAGFWGRYVLKAAWPPSTLRYLFGRARAANVGGTGPGRAPRSAYRLRVARTMRGAYWLTVLAAVHAAHAWPVYFLFWVVPLLTVYPFLMQLREVAHHSNAPNDGDLTNSRVFDVSPLLRFAVFPYGQDFHLTHHLFATLPHHRMPRAHATLNRYAPYRETVEVCRGYFFRRPGTAGPTVLDVLARAPGDSARGRVRSAA